MQVRRGGRKVGGSVMDGEGGREGWGEENIVFGVCTPCR